MQQTGISLVQEKFLISYDFFAILRYIGNIEFR